MVRVLRASGMPKDVLLWVRPVKSGHIVYLNPAFTAGRGDRPGHLKPWAGEEFKEGPPGGTW